MEWVKNFKELTVNHLTQNYLWHPAQKEQQIKQQESYFSFFPRSHLGSDSDKWLPNKETGKREKNDTFFIQLKSHMDHPHTVSSSLVCSTDLLFSSSQVIFAQNFPMKCSSIAQLSVLCYELGQSSHELDLMEKKERLRVMGF